MKSQRGRGLKALSRSALVKSGYALVIAILTTVLTDTVGAAAATSQQSVAHSAYGLQLSIPRPWGVAYFQNCPTRAAGTLLIGIPASLSNCALIPVDANILSMQPRQAGMVLPGPSVHLVVHGLRIISYPAAAASSGATTWFVPSKQVVLTATGPGSSAVLRTLTIATSGAIPAPGMLRGSVYLIAQIRTPVTGPVSISRLRSRGVGSTTVQAYDAQFWHTFRPGKYLLTGHAGDAPCPPVRVTIQSGKTTDAPEIKCQGE